jgi:hypothetical protein
MGVTLRMAVEQPRQQRAAGTLRLADQHERLTHRHHVLETQAHCPLDALCRLAIQGNPAGSRRRPLRGLDRILGHREPAEQLLAPLGFVRHRGLESRQPRADGPRLPALGLGLPVPRHRGRS